MASHISKNNFAGLGYEVVDENHSIGKKKEKTKKKEKRGKKENKRKKEKTMYSIKGS